MKSSISSVTFGYSSVFYSEAYKVTYTSGKEKFYRESDVPKTVLDFIEGVVSISSHTSDGHIYYTYRKE